jgi:two-component system, LytTR family, response regulator
MKVLIIEDEPLAAKDLANLLTRLEPSIEIQSTVTSVDGAKKWFSINMQPNLILSDIQLSDGISFEIFENMDLSCPIIFTTAYDDYAIRAFKLNSIDYLLKPIDKDELQAALSKFKTHSPEVLSEQLKSLIGGWNQPQKKYKERFLTVHRNMMVPITQQEIVFFHKDELIYLHTLSGEKYISDHQTLDEVETLLNPEFFFRVNRQYIIHVQSVGKIKTTHKGLTVQLKAPFNIEIDVSREKAVAFKNWVG